MAAVCSSLKGRACGLLWWLNGKESACQCRSHEFDPGSGRFLEKEMETHSSILAWEIPWTEVPGGLHPWGRKKLDRT